MLFGDLRKILTQTWVLVQSMKCIELKGSNPVQIHEPLILIQFNPAFDLVPGVSEKSDEFITCIFRVVLGMERRMGYHVKVCSKIFCLSGNPPLEVTVLGSARAFSWCPPLPVPRRPAQRRGPLPLGLQSYRLKLQTLVTWEARCDSRGTVLLSQDHHLVPWARGRHRPTSKIAAATPRPTKPNAIVRCWRKFGGHLRASWRVVRKPCTASDYEQ